MTTSKDRQKDSDQQMFSHLTTLHRVEADDVEMLLATVEKHRLTRKAEIFVRPSLLATSPDSNRWSDEDARRLGSQLGAVFSTDSVFSGD